MNAQNFGIGYGIEIEGDPVSSGLFTQVGAITDSNCSLCRIGIWAPQATSDIQVQGGTYSGSGAANSYGADFASIPGGSTTGSIRIIGSAFRNHATAAVNFFDCQGCQVVAIKGEQVQASPTVGIGVQADGTTHCVSDVVVGGGLTNYLTGVKVTSNCSNPLILLPALANVTTGVFNNAASPLELSGTNGLMLRGASASAPSPTLAGQFSYNTTLNQFVGGVGTAASQVFPTFPNTLIPISGNCVQWAASGELNDYTHPCSSGILTITCNGLFSTTATTDYFPSVGSDLCASTTVPTVGIPLPTGGTLKNLYVVVNTHGLNSSSGAVTVVVNGSTTLMTCTLGTSTNYQDTSDSATVTAGQTVWIQVTTQSGETMKDLRATFQVLK